jgi:small subunit ribosomal protein S27e
MESTGKVRAPFFRVSCKDCSNKQTVFSRAATKVVCTTCGTLIAEPTGGRAKIHGEIVETLQ